MAAYQKLVEIFEDISKSLNDINALKLSLQLDPAKTEDEAERRAAEIAHKSAKLYNPLKEKNVIELFRSVIDTEEKHLNHWDKKNFQLMQETYHREASVPVDIVAEIAQNTALFTITHPSLKADNNWEHWSHFLKAMVAPIRQKAVVLQRQLGSDTAYDAFLSWYTGGATAQDLETLFQPYEKAFPDLLQTALKKQKSTLEALPLVSEEKQKGVSKKILTMIGFDFDRGKASTYESAFCETVHRQTFVQACINPENVLKVIRTSCHEGGHALYHQGLPVNDAAQPIGAVQSYLVSEMVAYLYEHHVAPHPAFLSCIAQEVGIDANLLIAHSKKVEPSTVSLGCDELSLSAHPLIRFPFDKGLINGTVKIEDLPQLWNAKTEELLGMNAGDNHNKGVMAPVHWSKGFFGYFPIYLAAQMAAAQLAKSINVEALLNHNVKYGLKLIKDALGDLIFSQGSFLSTNELIEHATKEPLSADALIAHLQHRYT